MRRNVVGTMLASRYYTFQKSVYLVSWLNYIYLPKRRNRMALNIARQTGVNTPSNVLSFLGSFLGVGTRLARSPELSISMMNVDGDAVS